ncbi:DUF973 family protein [Candidatus Marsarchaeota archaeon]|nr:DUF973 family protein [Candidatus Marsarchaeota archaeon]
MIRSSMAIIDSGVEKLRTGVLVSIISGIIGIAAIVLFYIFIFIAAVSSSTTGHSFGKSAAVAITAAAFASLIAVCAGLGFYALLNMRTGFRIMSNSNSKYKTGVLGTTLSLSGLVLATAGVITIIAAYFALSPANPWTVSGFIPAIIGAVVGLVGGLLLIISFYRVGAQYDNSLVQVGAVLMIFIGIIGMILMYIGLLEIGKR